MRKFKNGDHIIILDVKTNVTHGKERPELIGEKGVIKRYHGMDICMIILEDDSTTYCDVKNIELDVQYYREERLKKLLDDE